MTDIVNPSPNRAAESFKTAGSISNTSFSQLGYIPQQTTEIAKADAIDETVLNDFAQTSGTGSRDVTIDPGEAFVYGSWVMRDVQTTVTIDSNSTQTVYAGWDKSQADTVIIGKSAAFGTNDQKIPLFEFTTDASGVTGVTDLRDIGKVLTLGTDEWFVQVDSTGELVFDEASRQMQLTTTGDLNIAGELTESSSL